MSRQIALDAVNCRSAGRLGHTEYSLEYSPLVQEVAPQGEPDRMRRFYDYCGFDLVWLTDEGPDPWGRGRITDMGHAEYASGGADRREAKTCPFNDVEEVLSFDACAEYGLPAHDTLVKYYENLYRQQSAAFPNQLRTGGFYNTLISGAIQAFGWDLLLMAAADQDRFANVLRTFGRRTLHYVRAWAETSIEVFIQHDDMVWTGGPFMDPAFYRRAVFPVYRELWEVLHDAGKKVLYCSDGAYELFMDDVAEAGADGFIFEPCNDFARVVERFGRTHCLIGSAVDCRTMTFGAWEQVKEEVDRTLKLAPQCRGFIFAVGNHIPANVPVSLVRKYLDYLQARRVLV